MHVRPMVRFIAQKLEETLQRNDSKPPWEEQPEEDVIAKFYEELDEFRDAIKSNSNYSIEWEGLDLMICIAAIIAKRHPYLSTLTRGK